jgi:uncharacterized protein (DUF362 family)/Pyruvate/2-oxoacid:ferredoxin oxidoreductase delta subunit
MGPPVSIVTCQTYDEKGVLAALRQSIHFIGGIEAFVKRGDRVLLKPNLLMGKSPEKAVTTHPSIIKGVLQIVHEAGGIPFIGDSPGIGSTAKAAEKAGIKAIADAMDCPVIEFDRPVLAPTGKGKTFKKIEIDQAVLDADVIISLPKWKTHSQMFLTLGVKNLFGCIPGPRKALWHLKAGEDRRLFARMLFDVYQIIQPSLTILDGIVGMEGDGPSSGRPISLGLILASRDALSLDQIVCDLLSLPRRSLMTNRVAQEQGVGKDPIEVVGEKIERVRISEFHFPKLLGTDWNLPGFLRRILKNGIASRPIIQKEVCKDCHHCVEICPPKALSPKGEELVFDYDQCIRCFCCQEICPEGAISIKPGWALRLAGRR